jgi:hypothetical protein
MLVLHVLRFRWYVAATYGLFLKKLLGVLPGGGLAC